jgi:hypothetical protein
MTMSPQDDFTTPPPSRRLLRPEEVDMTEAERRAADVKRLWGDDQKVPQPSLPWPPGRPSAPEVLRLLDYAHDAATGRPTRPARPRLLAAPGDASDAQIAAVNGANYRAQMAYEQEDESFLTRFRYWAALDEQLKTQLCADVRWQDGPAWLVSAPRAREVPNVVLHAPDEHVARQRYYPLVTGKPVPEALEYPFAISVTRYEPSPTPPRSNDHEQAPTQREGHSGHAGDRPGGGGPASDAAGEAGAVERGHTPEQPGAAAAEVAGDGQEAQGGEEAEVISDQSSVSSAARLCVNCGRDISPDHPEAMYCGSACRTAAYRKRQQSA